MLNMLIKGAAGQLSHQVLADAMYDVDRPSYLDLCPEHYIKEDIVQVAKLIDAVKFKSEAIAKMEESQHVDAGCKASYIEAMRDANGFVAMVRTLYGVAVAMLTTDLPKAGTADFERFKAKWFEAETAEDIRHRDAMFTTEAVERLAELSAAAFGEMPKADAVVDEVVEPIVETTAAQSETTVDSEPAKPVEGQIIRAVKPQHGNKNNKKHN